MSLGLSLFLNAFEDELQKPFNPFANSGIFRLSISRDVQALDLGIPAQLHCVTRGVCGAFLVGKEINCATSGSRTGLRNVRGSFL